MHTFQIFLGVLVPCVVCLASLGLKNRSLISKTALCEKREREEKKKKKLWRKGVGQANEANLTASFNSLVAVLCAQD